MSAGQFNKTKYETNQGNIVPIKVQPETADAVIGGVTNTAPTGDLTGGFPSARVSGSNRMIGINARTVTVRHTASLAGYKDDSPLTFPCLTPAFYDACQEGATGTYLGTACIVVGTKPEKIK